MADRTPQFPVHGDPRILHRREMMGRILPLKIALIVFFAVVAVRLVQIQVFESRAYQEKARRQYEAKVILQATRGGIYDHNGNLLVSNTMYVSFGADPTMLADNARAVAERFAEVFGKPREGYLAKLQKSSTRFVWLERHVPPRYARLVRADELDGVIELKEPQRLYNYESLAGQTIGSVDVDNKGLSGIELECDGALRGADGYVVMQRDGLGRRRPSVDYPHLPPSNGRSVQLTIDLGYQSIAEEELRRGVERNKADGGLVIIMDPSNGEVRALAISPPLDPGNVSAAAQSAIKNRVVTDMFEPGSVFKIVTAAAALERSLVKPGQKFFAENGVYTVQLPGGKSREITDTHKEGMITFQEAMELSSNIVMAKISDVIGAELLFTTARDFGFGVKTGVGVPGEVNGELKRPNQWSGTTLNSMSFGYEVAVTPMQLVCAYAAVANGGVLLKPTVVRATSDENGEMVPASHPEVVRRVISRATAETLTQFFVGVVDRGTGSAAKIKGMTVAGKTGTSRKVIEGHYAAGSYTASFVGYFPAGHPRLVCLVMLDNPSEGGYTGGLASAPIFRGIAEKIIATSGPFDETAASAIAGANAIVVPDVGNLKVDAARAMLAERGFAVKVEGKGDIVMGQTPASGAMGSRGRAVVLRTGAVQGVVPGGYAVVPDVRGLPIRRALNKLMVFQLDAGISGSGIVTGQTPPAGQEVRIGTRVMIQCAPKPLSVVSLN